jgi:hypothetical protein
VAPETRGSEPIQLIFDDSTTTIGYKTDSVRELISRIEEPAIAQGDTDADSTHAPDSLVVFSSRTGVDETKLVAKWYRIVGFISVCTILSLVVLLCILSDGYSDRDGSTLDTVLSSALAATSLVFLSSARWCHSAGFAFSHCALIICIVYSLAQPIFSCSEIQIAIKLLLVIAETILVYVSNVLRDVYSAQAIVIKRQ